MDVHLVSKVVLREYDVNHEIEFRTFVVNDIALNNVMFVSLNPEEIKRISTIFGCFPIHWFANFEELAAEQKEIKETRE